MPKHPGGRPLKYKKNFHPQDFITQSSAGKTKTQIATLWGIIPQTICEWEKDHKEFSTAVKLGKNNCKTYWMNLAFKAMVGKVTVDGKPVVIDYRYFNWIMMNCFGMGKEKKAPIVNVEFKKLLEAAKELEKLPQSELYRLAEQELAKVKKE